MATFKDVNGREWVVSLDAPTIKAIREELKVDPVDPEGVGYMRLANDPVLLCDALWVICREQARGASLTDIQFGRSFNGDTYEQAAGALLNAILDFFPKAKREFVKTIAEQQEKSREAAMGMALAKLRDPKLSEKIITAMEAAMEAEVANLVTRLNSASSSPDGVESTPAD